MSTTREVQVAKSRSWVRLAQLRDAREVPVPGVGGRDGIADLLFIDLAPAANWAHPCLYLLTLEGGEVLALPHDLPPSEEIELEPLFDGPVQKGPGRDEQLQEALEALRPFAEAPQHGAAGYPVNYVSQSHFREAERVFRKLGGALSEDSPLRDPDCSCRQGAGRHTEDCLIWWRSPERLHLLRALTCSICLTTYRGVSVCSAHQGRDPLEALSEFLHDGLNTLEKLTEITKRPAKQMAETLLAVAHLKDRMAHFQLVARQAAKKLLRG
jgi:hypothetical protein